MQSLSAIIIITFFSAAAYAQAGELDSTFGGDGIVTTGIGNSNDEALSVAVQPDGKIVAAGESFNGTDYDFGLVRYNADGSLDISFGTNGKVTTAIGLAGDWAYSVVIQPDGKILAGGRSWNDTNSDFALVRYNADGNLDNNFGAGGIVTIAIGLGDDGINSLAIQDDGKIIAAGYSGIIPNLDFAIVRFNSNGTLDNSFGTGGKVITPVGSGEDFATSVAIQSDEKIILAGFSLSSGNGDFALVRYNADGTLDISFNVNGKVTTDISSSDDLATSIAIQPDGKIVVGGRSGNYPDYDFALGRYNIDGTLDIDFSSDGKITTAISASDDEAYSVMLQPDGKIVEVGFSVGVNSKFILVRYNSNGSTDNNFGTNGIVSTSLSSGNAFAASAAFQLDGKIIIAGDSCSGATCAFAVARYLSGLNVGISNFSSSHSSPLIYPNPLRQTETLEYTLTKNESLTISLYDVSGRLIRNFISNEERSAGVHKETLNIGELTPGNYFLTISNGSQKMKVKMVKQ